MATIYRKTEKGQAEIETRLFRLMPRLRTALILVDGRRSDTELAKLIPGDPAQSLQALLDEGFIDVVALVEPRPALRPTPTQGMGEPPPRQSASARSPAVEQRRREATRALTDQVGPVAEELAMRMEKCHDWAQLLPVLQLAQQVIRNARGASAAADFAARYIDTPPA